MRRRTANANATGKHRLARRAQTIDAPSALGGAIAIERGFGRAMRAVNVGPARSPPTERGMEAVLADEAFAVVESTEGMNPEESRLHLADEEAGAAALNDDLLSLAAELLAEGGIEGQAERAVALALSQQGMREEPCGSNRNPYSRYFKFGAQLWCADFISWAFDQASDRDREVPWGYPSRVENITNWARSRGLIVPHPHRGAIFTYRNGAHAGLVTGVRGGRFTTIEGNTSGPDGRVCWVYGHARPVAGPFHFVRWPLG